MSMVLHGGRGKTLFVTRHSLRIVQEHLGERRDTALLMRHITAVEVKKPGAFDGFIQFSIAGGVPHDNASSLTGGAYDAARDETSITFADLESYDLALKIKLHVETCAGGNGHAAGLADELRTLKALLDEGILTADEFAGRKQLLLRER